MSRPTLDKILTELGRLNLEHFHLGIKVGIDKPKVNFFEIPKELIDARNELAKLIKAYGYNHDKSIVYITKLVMKFGECKYLEGKLSVRNPGALTIEACAKEAELIAEIKKLVSE